MLDGELRGRTPAKRSYGQVVGAAVVNYGKMCYNKLQCSFFATSEK